MPHGAIFWDYLSSPPMGEDKGEGENIHRSG